MAASANPIAADCLRAERACYFARQGRLSEARAEISALRKKYETTPNVAISAWLSLAEGLEIYFRNFGAGSRDKVLRAHALSSAAGLIPLKALSSAWLSQMDFTRFDFDSLVAHAKQALELSTPKDHAARSRACLVLAQALHLAGRLDLALLWYRRAHTHATSAGDDATISALMHNMDCMRLDNLRQAKLTGVSDANEVNLVLTGTKSTNQFDELVGASSLSAMRPLMQARILSLQGKPAEALALYDEHLAIAVDEDYSRMKSDLLSDIAWCRFSTGDEAGARSSAVAAESSLEPDTQIDDRAATHTRLGWLYSALGDDGPAQHHRDRATDSWNTFVELQGSIVAAVAGMSKQD